MQNTWQLSELEWKKLSEKLSDGGSSSENKRLAIEACLYRYFNMLGNKYPTFNWNNLPKTLGISAITANRRFREWTESGEWLEFWDALMDLRHGCPKVPVRKDAGRLASPIPALILELERAYIFFNHRFFGGTLSNNVVIAIEPPQKKRKGYFCSRLWTNGKISLGHIAITTSTLGGSPADALEVLLHEMVHLRNDQFGFQDTHPRTQYHNRLFRDVAQLVGLNCPERHPDLGYARTELTTRATAAIRLLRPQTEIFKWKARGGRVSG